MCRRLFNPVLTQSTRAARLEIQRIGILQKETRGNGGARSAQFRARARVSHPRTTQAMAPPQGYAPVATAEYEPDSKPAVPQVPVAPAQAQGIPPEQPQVLLGHPVLVRPQGVHKGTPLARFDARILRLGRFARFPRETACDARSHHPRVATEAASSAANLLDELARLKKKRKIETKFSRAPFPVPDRRLEDPGDHPARALLPRRSTPARPRAPRGPPRHAATRPSPLGPGPSRPPRSWPPPTRPQAPVRQEVHGGGGRGQG